MKVLPLLLLPVFVIAQEEDDIVEESYHFDIENIRRMDVSISYSLGALSIADNPDSHAIDGTISYYPKWMRPEVDYHKFGSKGKFNISVESDIDWEEDNGLTIHIDDWRDFRHQEFENEAMFYLPPNIPMDMEMDFGLGKININLSNLNISDFDLECGLSDVKLIMETPNSSQCRELSIETGLGDFNAIRLGNLRPRELTFKIGLGSATIDLTGDITHDLEGEIDIGLGSLDLILPNHANIRLEIGHTFLSSVDIDDLVQKGDEWVSPEWDRKKPTIELEIRIGLGSVDIDIE